jgi:hypothetical protein
MLDETNDNPDSCELSSITPQVNPVNPLAGKIRAELRDAARLAAITGAVLLIAAGGIWGLCDTINTTLVTGVIP